MIHVYVVSAFSKDGRGGNRAGVVLDRPDLTAAQKRAVAAALHYSETAFVTASDRGDVRLEYFTPAGEVPLCGHATIASFTLLHLLRRLPRRELVMETGAGLLRIAVSAEGAVRMEQTRPLYGEVLPPQALAGCIDPAAVHPSLPIQIVSTGLRDILLPLPSWAHLSALRPDLSVMKDISRAHNVIGVHAFALSEEAGVTAFCRNFAPLAGIDEESATGTSSCALACYLAKYVRQQEHFVFEQGYELGAPSRITVDLTFDSAGAIDSVFVGGTGYLVCEKDLKDPGI